MSDVLPDAEAVLDYLRTEAQAGAAQVCGVRDLAVARLGSEVPSALWVQQFAKLVRLHIAYLEVLRGTISLATEEDVEEDEEY